MIATLALAYTLYGITQNTILPIVKHPIITNHPVIAPAPTPPGPLVLKSGETKSGLYLLLPVVQSTSGAWTQSNATAVQSASPTAIPLLDFTFKSITPTDPANGLPSGKQSFSMTLKLSDSLATPQLHQDMQTGRAIPELTIDQVKPGNGGLEVYAEYKFKNAVVLDVKQVFLGNGSASDTLTLSAQSYSPIYASN